MEQLPREVQRKNRSTSLQELFESIYNQRNRGIGTDAWDGELCDHDSEPDDCYCE